MGCAYEVGKLTLEGGDLRPLGDPTGEHGLASGIGFFLREKRHCNRDHETAASRLLAGANDPRSVRHHSTSSPKPCSSGTVARNPSSRSAFAVEASRRGTGF